MIRKLVRFIFSFLVPVVVLSIAVFVGWIRSTEMPSGTLFATVLPLAKGTLPPTIVGHGRMEGTPPVPADMKPAARPIGESFLKLASGYDMPQNGIGMCCRPTAYDDVLVERTVLWYLLLGGRLIDTAHVYLNHKAIGKGIKEAIKRGVPRSEIFVTTKIFPTHFGYNTTMKTIPTYLEELDLEYIDLILMHMPDALPIIGPLLGGLPSECNGISKNECRQETFKALSHFVKEGVVRSVGVSNFGIHHIEGIQELDETTVAPISVNQIQYFPWSIPEWVDTFNYCQKNGIAITAYNSLGGTLQHAMASTADTLKGLAKKYDKAVAQIMLRWAIQNNAAVIPGTGNPKHMEENLNVSNYQLSEEDVAVIDELRHDEKAKSFFNIPPVWD